MNILEQGQTITWLFWILTLLVFLFQFYSWVFYRRQISDIASIQSALTEKPNQEIGQLLSRLAITPGSPLSTRVRIATEAARHTRPISVSELSALTEEDDSRRIFNIVPNTAITTFLIAGLAGTIYLLKTLLIDVDLGRIVNAGGGIMTPELKKAISSLYGGFGHAFAASFWGIFCNLILVFLRNILVSPKKARFFQSLDEFTVEQLLPILQPREVKPPEALVKASEVAEKVSETMRQIATMMEQSSNANVQTARTAKETVEEMKTFALAMNKAANAVDRCSRHLERTFNDDGNWARVNKILIDSQDTLRNSLSALESTIVGLDSKITGMQSIIEIVLGKLNDLFTIAETLSGTAYRGLREELSALRGGLRDVSEKAQLLNTKVYDSFRSEVGKLRDRMELVTKVGIEMTSKSLPLLHDELVRLQQKIDSDASRLQEINQVVSAGFTAIQTSTTTLIAEVSVLRRGVIAQVNTGNTSVKEQITMRETVESTANSIINSVATSVESMQHLSLLGQSLISSMQEFNSRLIKFSVAGDASQDQTDNNSPVFSMAPTRE
ncbi:MAG: hypothetical protein U1F76_18985 [Candidatus Competibacteraceae bacterium]